VIFQPGLCAGFFIAQEVDYMATSGYLVDIQATESQKMHLISLRALKEAVERFPEHAEELLQLGSDIEKGYFETPERLKALYPSLDSL